MIGFLLADIFLTPLEKKEVLVAGEDYFFSVEGKEEKNFSREYLEETFYVVSDFEKDASRYFHVVYLGNFKQSLKYKDTIITFNNIEESPIKTKEIEKFIFFKYFQISLWLKMGIALIAFIIFCLIIFFFRKKILLKREKNKAIKEFFEIQSRSDFENILKKRSYYEFHLKKDLSSLVDLIKEKQYHPNWDEDFLNLCKKELKKYA